METAISAWHALCGSPGAGEAGWIAVAERLPEAGVDVLTFDSEGLCDVDRIEAGTEREWEFSIAPNHITHWMKLPSPPAARAVMK